METRVKLITIHQCMYGLKSDTGNGEQLPAYKPTTLMNSMPALSTTLDKRCNGKHRHCQLQGGNRTKKAQEHLEELCKEKAKAF